MFPILTVMVALPALGAIVLFAVPGAVRARGREIALGFAAVELVLAAVLFFSFDQAKAGAFQFSETYAWIPQIGTSWALGVNGIGLSLVLLSAILVPVAILSAWRDDKDPQASGKLPGPCARQPSLHGRHLRRARRLPLLRAV